MRDNPSSENLLKIAEDTFRKEILPQLSADKKYTALMIANAMRIVARQIEHDENSTVDKNQKEVASLSQLLNKTINENDPDALINLNRQFASAIRNGEFSSDKPSHEKVKTHLLTAVQNRLAEVNPKAIQKISDAKNDRG